ncbi:MAG TPA: hypothetical protein VNH11_07790 [Pirellulales bacterium]|nr:hypothetical protein [Pirellulales bacterium]
MTKSHEPLRITRGAAFTAAVSLLLVFLPLLTSSNAQQSDNNAADEQKNRAAEAGAKQRFSFGGKVEVLALGTHGPDDSRWWAGDGKPLKSLPAPLIGCFVRQTDERGNKLASLPVSWRNGGDTVNAANVVWRRIIVRVDGLPDDADVRWHSSGAHATGDGEVSVEGQTNPKGYFSRYVGVPPEQKTTTIKFGVATGKWTTEAEVQRFGRTAIGKQNHGIVFSEGFDMPNGATIIVSHDYFDQDVRVVAFDKQGMLHDSAGRGGASGGKVHQMQATFPKLNRDDIDHFEFQTREYEYVETAALPLLIDPPAKP